MREENSGRAYYFIIFLFILFGLFDLAYRYIWVMSPFGLEMTPNILLKYFIFPGYFVHIIMGGMFFLLSTRAIRRPDNVNRFNIYTIFLIFIYLCDYALLYFY